MILFCKRAVKKRQYSAKETYNFIDPTNCSQPVDDSSSKGWECHRLGTQRKNMSLFCKRAVKKRQYCAKETYDLIDRLGTQAKGRNVRAFFIMLGKYGVTQKNML